MSLPNQFKGGNNLAHNPGYDVEPANDDDNPIEDPISSRLRRPKRTAAGEVDLAESTNLKHKKRRWHHCIINQCNVELGNFADWHKHLIGHHQDAILPNDHYRCMVEECDRTFNGDDPRKAWLKHAKTAHPGGLGREQYCAPRVGRHGGPVGTPRRKLPRPRVYGDGGRENLTPRDGTFLKRLVERLSREGNVQETQEAGGVASHPRNHHPMRYDLENPLPKTKSWRSLRGVGGERDNGGTAIKGEIIEDEIMGGYEEGAGEEYMKGENHHAMGKVKEE